MAGRAAHHLDRRNLSQHCMHPFNLDIVEPICNHSVCDAFVSALVMFSNATRVPLGMQNGEVSCLGYASVLQVSLPMVS